ncbi:uncharacterized protein LOC131024506 [Salvia miltiorrhiza]|uniref:uncharacterized protein LOC130988674 n=1 Tax=Salvia miltiorrhiza TaxID=226208 RepID=UPI0025ACC8E2|nr:uncharacterized protein LOC130988674 [Salvia miltiorrhiza]XP_057783532.1 uncharacterized protein LOC131001225 [Salvia miltiorrhiza]XP_057786333.1 uncharacterized protein LOC131003796 [Salvia miltiorrhiza]XP_057786334.1 uncharacterized protein LOC131003797 [Salvia miltiorrhiza]XP_057786335.1 uncharacterized protein LOC131003798 [Salvia miltiorrhiza]XP_057786343.1 uncharacterized protein LOC131003806 [Salvia miltiorrhiza]XP_057790167.1 uncharacterized protein LOC131007032 [Salvia miltiorrhiz
MCRHRRAAACSLILAADPPPPFNATAAWSCCCSPEVDGSGLQSFVLLGVPAAVGLPGVAAGWPAIDGQQLAGGAEHRLTKIGDNRGSVAVRQPPATTSHRGCPPPDLDSHTQSANTKGFCARIIYCNCSNKSFNSFLVTSVHKYIFSNCKSMNLLLIFFIYQSICKSELMSMCWYSGVDVYN